MVRLGGAAQPRNRAGARARTGAGIGESPGLRRRVISSIAGVVSVALVVTLAVIAAGFDARETPREDASVWVERAAGQFARVNTETAEIDTVRTADNPSAMLQSGELAVLLTGGLSTAWLLDAAYPQDVLDSDAGDEAEGAALRTPEGTRQVIAAGDVVLFHTARGEVFVSQVTRTPAISGAVADAAGSSTVSGGTVAPGGGQITLTEPTRLGASAQNSAQRTQNGETGQANAASENDANQPADAAKVVSGLVADAVALDHTGRVAIYSANEGGVRWANALTGQIESEIEPVRADVAAENAQLAIIGKRWVLFDSANGDLFLADAESQVTLDTRGTAKLQASTATANVDVVSVADESGLWQVELDGNTAIAQRAVNASGVAAQPRFAGDELVAAWLGAGSATMWSSTNGESALELDASVEEGSEREPEIHTNGSRAVIIDRLSGMMWRGSDAKLIPVEQWSLVTPPEQEAGTVVTQDVTEQEPPVAVDDSFGIRAGEPALLPVMLNDFDPNRNDILTIVSDGLGDGLPAEFGTVGALSDSQELVVQPSGAASGQASFTYRITDGVTISEPATVTLRVVDDSQNSPPEWCGVEKCVREWLSPEIAPGGSMLLPVLEGWVDPEGDTMMLTGARVAQDAQLRALVTEDGRLALRHTDPNAPDGETSVMLTVTDARGASTERELRVRIRSGAEVTITSSATTVRVGEPTQYRVLDRVTGGSGSFQLISATVQQGSLSVNVNEGAGELELAAVEPQSALVSVTVRDNMTAEEATGIVRVTSVETRDSLALPPLRAFVRPLADTTVDVLSSIAGASSRALSVQSATVSDGQLRADVIEHSRIRVSGSTPDGAPGRIGSVDVVVAEGNQTATTKLTVFQVAEVVSGAIAVADTATVRAGQVVDIAVLANDVAPPGERLVLDPTIGTPGVEGELAFASGSNVRYLAPQVAGTYTLSYTTYGASSPEVSDVGQVRVTVLPVGANRDPAPQTLTVRVAPGAQVRAPIALSGVDPDGDRVRLVSVGSPDDAKVVTSVLSRSNAVKVEAAQTASKGTHTVQYTVRDGFGGEAKAALRIIVTDPDPGGSAPVVYSDYVRMAKSATEPAVVRPLDNDIDPSGGTLELVSVVPNVPGGADSAAYQQLSARLDTSELTEGIVRISGGELGTVSFITKVRSTTTKSTSEGLIVVQVSERVGQQAPAVSDTVLSVKDRADFATNGVDVVTDRVRWASGDVGALKLTLHDNNRRGYAVSGNSIVGTYRAEGDLVTFKLSGVDSTGETVETFGFLIVPPLDELKLTLKPGAKPISVNEQKSVEFDVADLLDLGPNDQVELGGTSFAVQRSQASCTATGPTTISYSAGREGPWSDTCTIRVRLKEQRSYTVLPIEISIVPDDPVAQLTPLTRTISPGEAENISLTDMLTWQGGRSGSDARLTWQVSGQTSAFELTTSGTTLRAVARADAVPGSQETLTITATGYGTTEAALTLRVGEAAVNAPKGATISLQCTVGDSCSTPLVGVAGEFDPFAGKTGGGLRVASVDSSACSSGVLAADGNTLRVTWPDNRGPGEKCTAGFTVRDAQNRVGNGIIEFDAQGVPRAPASISLVAYDRSSITLEVLMGDAANAHPATTGVIINQDGGQIAADCEPSGATYRCVVDGLEQGERHSYTARALNSVGESDPTLNAVSAWAYEPPELNANQVSIEQLSAESASSATVRVTVTANDPNIASIKVTAGSVNGTISGDSGSVTLSGVAPGQIQYSAQPISQFAPPTGGSGDGMSTTPQSFTVIGLPTISGFTSSSADGSSQVNVSFNVFGNYDSTSNVRWGAVLGASCDANNSGTSAEKTLTAGGNYRSEQVTLCAVNSFGSVTQTQTVWVGGNLPQLTLGSYTIGATPVPTGSGVSYELEGEPTVTGKVNGATVTFSPGGQTLELDPDIVRPVTATQCIEPGAQHCSQASAPAAWLNAPTTVTVQPSGACYVASNPPTGESLAALLDISQAAKSSATVTVVSGSEKATTIELRVSWSGDFGGLLPANIVVCYET